MGFYTNQHVHYCGIDLHARSLYVCILDQDGNTRVHQKLPCDRERLLQILEPYCGDLVVAVECLFCWYWVADCADEGFTFVLGHALEMKAIHGGKSKNDRAPGAAWGGPKNSTTHEGFPDDSLSRHRLLFGAPSSRLTKSARQDT